MDGRRVPEALTAGVPEAIDETEGVICGVGKGPMRASAGVGGAMFGLGSRKRGGKIVAGVGVLSCEVLSTTIALIAGLACTCAKVGKGSSAQAADSMADLVTRSGSGMLSSSGVSNGTSFLQRISSTTMPWPGAGGGGIL